MEGKSFERTLPRGYRLATVLDASKGWFAIVFSIVSILLFIVVTVPLVVFALLFASEGLSNGIAPFTPLFFVGYILYIVLHELTHGAAYKKLTGEKLTYGFTLTCAYCGVPKIFTYRKTALISVLAPFVVFTVLFIPMLVISYFVDLGVYFALVLIFAGHISGCSGDLYVTCLLLFKYKDGRTLMNDTGPRMALFVPDESLGDTEDEKTAEFVAEMQAEQFGKTK